MSVHVAEATVDSFGRIVLDRLPFEPGEKVEVIVRSHDRVERLSADLRDSVLRYDRPFVPAAESDWESSR
jgi:hypothetical protein